MYRYQNGNRDGQNATIQKKLFLFVVRLNLDLDIKEFRNDGRVAGFIIGLPEWKSHNYDIVVER